MKRLSSSILLLLIIPIVVIGQNLKALDEKNGFKDFKFGMTPEEASKILASSETFTNPSAKTIIFRYSNTPINRIGDYSFDVSFYQGRSC